MSRDGDHAFMQSKIKYMVVGIACLFFYLQASTRTRNAIKLLYPDSKKKDILKCRHFGLTFPVYSFLHRQLLKKDEGQPLVPT